MRDRSCAARLGAAHGKSGPIEPRLLPELQGERHRVDLDRMPPSGLVALSVKLAMVDTTERNRELIADLAAEGARLSKAEMVRIARGAAAHDTGLPCDELAVLLVAQSDALLEDRSATVPPER